VVFLGECIIVEPAHVLKVLLVELGVQESIIADGVLQPPFVDDASYIQVSCARAYSTVVGPRDL
jgi:hypothetical protein